MTITVQAVEKIEFTERPNQPNGPKYESKYVHVVTTNANRSSLCTVPVE